MSHFDMATLGVRANHKAFALSGVGLSLQIIVTMNSGGGGGVLPRPDHRRELKSLFSLIQVKFFGKEENFLFYMRANAYGVTIEVKLLDVKKTTNDTKFKVMLEKVKKIAQKPIIKIKEML